MISQVKSMALLGIDGFVVEVEADISSGLPAFDIVGLPDAAVKESKERIRAAIKNTGLAMPSKRITLNLAPADVKKEGTHFDLALAVGILVASKQMSQPKDDVAFIGELSLNGDLRRVNGVLPMVISAYQKSIKEVYLPLENAREAAVIEGLTVYGVASLKALAQHLTGEKKIEPFKEDYSQYCGLANDYGCDFKEVKGQAFVKRALEIAAAGGHNVLMIGPPGSGKTMIAQRIPTILPDMSFEEALEVTKVHSLAGFVSEKDPILRTRPFRHPHHTISSVGLSGGGSNPRPGEISLSHNGVLFLDELPEFRRDALEAMRQPLEDGTVTITRASGTVTYPSNIMLVASMNPCPCGFYGDSSRECTCSQTQIMKYMHKISGPLLDRIDIHIEVPAVKYDELEAKEYGESSAQIKERVDKAREIQFRRNRDGGVFSNSRLTPSMMEEFCVLDADASALLKDAYESLGLSARAHNRILKVARTIADLAGEEKIGIEHIAEAIQYRALDKKFFN